MDDSNEERNAFARDEHLRLPQVGEEWLDSPWDEDPTRTPRGIINLERLRQPNGGQFHPIDPDCPCCRALAEMPGIGFWHMDGCNIDDLFAFAFYHETKESWDRDQADYAEFSRQFDREHELAKELNLPPLFSNPSPQFADVSLLVFPRRLFRLRRIRIRRPNSPAPTAAAKSQDDLRTQRRRNSVAHTNREAVAMPS